MRTDLSSNGNKTLEIKLLRRKFSLLTMVVGLALFCLSAPAFSAENKQSSDYKMLWATYVPWSFPGTYNTFNCYNPPVDQFSADMLTALRQEIVIAQKYGVDGFLVCLSSPRNGKQDFNNLNAYKNMLKAARGTGFYINPCLDRDAERPEDWANAITRLVRELGDDPSIYKEDGKIVFSSYVTDNLGVEYWKTFMDILKKNGIEIKFIAHPTYKKTGSAYGVLNEQDVLDFKGIYGGVYQFSCHHRQDDCYDVLAGAAKKLGVEMWATLIPGYTGAARNWRNEYHIPENGFWRARHVYRAGARHPVSALHLTTWNDYDETAMIPTVFQLDSRLRIANYYKQTLNAGKDVPQAKPNIFIAGKLELLMGDNLSLSISHLPVDGKCGETLKLSVADGDGRMIGSPRILKLDNAREELLEAEFPGDYFLEHSFVRVVAEYENKSYSLPWVKINASRVDNPIDWATPLDRTLPVEYLEKLEFNLSLKDGLATGRLKGQFDAPISRATIFRNSVVAFSLDGKSDDRQRFNLLVNLDAPELHTADIDQLPTFRTERSVVFYVKCLNGKITRASRRYTMGEMFQDGRIAGNFSQSPVMFEVAGNPEEIELELNYYKQPEQRIKLVDIIRTHGVSVTINQEKGISAFVRTIPFDPVPWETPEVDANSIDTQFSFVEDIPTVASNSYCVRVELKNGKVLWSNPVFPNSSSKPATDNNVLLTGRSWFGDFGWNTGKYKYDVRSVKNLSVSPRVLRKDTYNLEHDTGMNLANSSGMRNARMYDCKRVEFKQRQALELDGEKSHIKLPPRSMMNGAFTLSIHFAPEETGKSMGIFADKASESLCHIYLKVTENGTLEAQKSTVAQPIEESPARPWANATHAMHKVVTKNKVRFNEWNHVVLVYDLKSLNIYLNGRLEGTVSIPPYIIRSGNWPTVGCRSSGDRAGKLSEMFKGKIGAFTLFGYSLDAKTIVALN